MESLLFVVTFLVGAVSGCIVRDLVTGSRYRHVEADRRRVRQFLEKTDVTGPAADPADRQ